MYVKMETAYITDKVIENPYTVTFALESHMYHKAGQFIMVCIPGLGEKPFTIAGYKKGKICITVRNVGKFTNALTSLKVGDFVKIRGPYGNGFTLTNKALLVAGGAGLACLASIANELFDYHVIYGERSDDYIIYKKVFPKDNITHYTLDGSYGIKGTALDGFKDYLLSGKEFNRIYCCGPELLMYEVAKICEDKALCASFSIERFMKCGVGICGQCVCGGNLVCKDGPVFDANELLSISDFGKRKLSKSGAWDYLT